MRITNDFAVPAPIDQAWALLTDIPAIAPCLPGASLTSSEDGVHHGRVKVKVGPVTAQYQGTAEFTERDDDAYRATITAKGRDVRGAGHAQATIQAQLTAEGERTRVLIDTDLTISGKVAQFGRGVMDEVSQKLLGQFATCLEGKLSPEPALEAVGAGPPADAAPVTGAPATLPVEPVSTPTNDDGQLDLIGLAGGAVAKRVVPVMIALAVIAAIVYVWKR